MSHETQTPADPAAIDSLIEKKVQEALDQRLDAALSRLEQRLTDKPAVSDRITLVVFSGELDRIMTSFVIATGAASMGMSVSMFFTFWGLTAVKKTTILNGKAPLERMMASMLPSNPGGSATSSLNMLGLGPLFFRKMMKDKNVASVEELINLAQELEVRMIACQMSMDVMGTTKDELIDNLEYGGVATYLGDARDSRITLFV